MTLLACLMLEKVKLHQKFTKWPLHLTIVPWFTISPQYLSSFLSRLDQAAGRLSSISLEPDRIDYFGPEKTTRVVTVKGSRGLISLHQDMLSIIKSSNGVINDSRHVGPNYIPHVSVATNNTIDSMACHEMFLVSFNEKNVRQIVEIIKFG